MPSSDADCYLVDQSPSILYTPGSCGNCISLQPCALNSTRRSSKSPWVNNWLLCKTYGGTSCERPSLLPILGTLFSSCGPKKAEGIWSAEIQEPVLPLVFSPQWEADYTRSRSGAERSFHKKCLEPSISSSVSFSVCPSTVNSEGPSSVPTFRICCAIRSPRPTPSCVTRSGSQRHPRKVYWCAKCVLSSLTFQHWDQHLGFEDPIQPKFYIWGSGVSNGGELRKKIRATGRSRKTVSTIPSWGRVSSLKEGGGGNRVSVFGYIRVYSDSLILWPPVANRPF